MKRLLSKDVLLSLREVVSLKSQTKRSKKAILSLPDVWRHIFTILAAAPYLMFAYIIIGGIDVQNRIVGPVDPETAIVSSLTAIALLTVANGLAYIEAYNTHTTGERISKPGWYVLRRAPRLVGVIMLSTSIIILGLFMFILPGLYFALRLSLASPACIIEDAGIRESMLLSMEATKGQLTMVYTTFSMFGMIFLPLFIFLILTTGWLEIIVIFLLLGIIPAFIHLGLGVLYMNSMEDSNVNIY